MSKLTVLDLFSGIGGFSLGLERTGGFKTVAFCEIDNYCQRVLRKHWPDTYIHSDIRTLGAQHFEHYRKPDVIVGGFPCQDISVAGKGVGLSGERSGLWFEMLRVIRELRPSWVLVENVPRLRTLGLSQVVSGLEDEGYTVCDPVELGAWTVGADHKRERIWVLAYSEGARARVHGKDLSVRVQASAGRGDGEDMAAPFRASYQPDVDRVTDGIPRALDRIGACGNSVVPQIPELFGRFILSMEAGA